MGVRVLPIVSHMCQSSRKKSVAWARNFEKMESLLLEFEIAEDDKARAFNVEVDDKYKHMVAFKKAFSKFVMTLENMLKQNADLPDNAICYAKKPPS